MPFPPEEIETRRFVPAFRGYDRDEVETFLRAVAADYRRLLRRTTTDQAEDLVIEIRMSGRAMATAATADGDDAEADLRSRIVRLQDLVGRLHEMLKSHEK